MQIEPSSLNTEDNLKSDFEDLTSKITELLQAKQQPLKASFPTGVIRKIVDLQSRFPYLSHDESKKVACAIQLIDISRWHLNVWDIRLTAGTMFVWHCTLPVLFAIEAIAFGFLEHKNLIDGNVKFKKSVDLLNSHGIINQKLRDELQDLVIYRNTVHLKLKPSIKLHNGLPSEYNRSIIAFKELERVLLDKHQNSR